MPSTDQTDTTALLEAASRGDEAAASQLAPLVYEDLRQRAGAFLRRERPDHTLQPTALVNEAYLRLVDQTRIDWKGRTHFLAVASETMRRILIDHARHHRAAKRGGGRGRVPLKAWIAVTEDWNVEPTALADALEELNAVDPRAGRIVELRFFGGLTQVEVGEVVGLSERSVRKEWAWARAWLGRKLGEEAVDG